MSDTAEEATVIAAATIEGIAAGFSQVDAEALVTYGQVARMLYECAARIRDSGQDAIEQKEKG